MKTLFAFRAQAAVIILASLSVAALAFVWIRDVVRNTEQTLLDQARSQCAAAVEELRNQFVERGAYGDSLAEMPMVARDVSLRGVAQAVLRSYGGVSGGFYAAGAIGSSAQPPDELPQVIEKAKGTQELASMVFRNTRDLLVVTAVPVNSTDFAWAARRLSDALDPAAQKRRWILAALVLSVLISVSGVISISLYLRRGVNSLKQDLALMESDLSHRPAKRSGEFGEIAHAIAEMAEQRAKLESNLRHQDRLAALGKAVAGVAHEIRNPLNAMRLTLELLERRTRLGAPSAPPVTAAIEQVDRLNRIVDRLLTFGRPELNDRTVQAVFPLIDHAVAMAEKQIHARNVRVNVTCSKDLQCDADAAQIEQVLLNLFLNAIEFSPDGTSIDVRAEELGEYLEIAMTDRGPGIPPEDAPRVFDAFFTTRADGTGLGLAVSREIVANHGGDLTFSTSVDGTTFFVRLPKTSRAIEAATGAA